MGEIASIIAAVAFALLVLFLALPLWKLGKLFDQIRVSVRDIAASTDSTVNELNATVRDAHAQLTHVDAVTTSTARVAQDVSAMSTLVTSTLARPLIGMLALQRTVGDYFRGRKSRSASETADFHSNLDDVTAKASSQPRMKHAAPAASTVPQATEPAISDNKQTAARK